MRNYLQSASRKKDSSMIEFIFDEKKAAQAAAHLLKLNGGSMNYMVLIKLLYLADREALVETGNPITCDKMVSMPHGPVLSGVYDLINMGKDDFSPWYEYISEPERYEVSLVRENLEDEELSNYEINLLEKIHKKYGHLNKWALRDFTHTLPEWDDPKGSSSPIYLETILESANKTKGEINRIAEDAQELKFFQKLTQTH